MTPDEAEVLRYIEGREYASSHEVARVFGYSLPVAEWRLRALLRHRMVDESQGRYYRATDWGSAELTKFDDPYRGKPFADGRWR